MAHSYPVELEHEPVDTASISHTWIGKLAATNPVQEVSQATTGGFPQRWSGRRRRRRRGGGLEVRRSCNDWSGGVTLPFRNRKRCRRFCCVGIERKGGGGRGAGSKPTCSSASASAAACCLSEFLCFSLIVSFFFF